MTAVTEEVPLDEIVGAGWKRVCAIVGEEVAAEMARQTGYIRKDFVESAVIDRLRPLPVHPVIGELESTLRRAIKKPIDDAMRTAGALTLPAGSRRAKAIGKLIPQMTIPEVIEAIDVRRAGVDADLQVIKGMERVVGAAHLRSLERGVDRDRTPVGKLLTETEILALRAA